MKKQSNPPPHVSRPAPPPAPPPKTEARNIETLLGRIEELEAMNERYFRAGFSQGYGSDVIGLDRVGELFKKTAEILNNQ